MSIRRCFFETKRNICGFFFFNTGQEIVSEQFGDPVVVKTPGCPEGMEVPSALGIQQGRTAPFGTRFCLQSLVCYTFCGRGRFKGVVRGGNKHFEVTTEQADFGAPRAEIRDLPVGKIRLFVCRWWGKL